MDIISTSCTLRSCLSHPLDGNKEAEIKLLCKVGWCLQSDGQYTEAEKLHRQALKMRMEVLGPEHPNTLISMSWIASALGSQGRYAEAEQMHRQTLELRKKVLGPEHPDTLISMSWIASVLSSQGKHAEARQMYEQMLALKEEVL